MRFSIDAPVYNPSTDNVEDIISENSDNIQVSESVNMSQYDRFLDELGKTYIEFETVSTTEIIDGVRRSSYRDIQTYAPYLFHVLTFSVTSAITRQEMIIKMQMIPVISSTDQIDALSVDDDQIKAYGILDIDVDTDYKIVWTSDIQMSDGCRIVSDFPLFFFRKGDKVKIKMYLIRSIALGGSRWNCISSFRFDRIDETDETDNPYGKYLVRIQTRGNVDPLFIRDMLSVQDQKLRDYV